MPAEPFIGELMLFGGNFAPKGWALCNGQQLSIAANSALFSILGTTYGGDGIQWFKLPDLRGRAALHFGHGPGLSNYDEGMVLGSEQVTLTTSQMPAHVHALHGRETTASTSKVAGAFLAEPVTVSGDGVLGYAENAGTPADLNFNSIGIQGGSEAHQNMQPSLVLNYCIALEGIYPSRN